MSNNYERHHACTNQVCHLHRRHWTFQQLFGLASRSHHHPGSRLMASPAGLVSRLACLLESTKPHYVKVYTWIPHNVHTEPAPRKMPMSGLLGPSDGERGVMNGESSSLARIEKRCRPRLVTELEPCVSCEEGNIWDCVAVSPR